MAKIEIPTLPVPNFTDHIHRWQKQAWNHYAEHPEIRHRVRVWHRRARKTTLEINRLLTEAARTKNRTFAYIGPTQKQAKATIWRDPMMLKRYMPDSILKKPFNETELFAEFKSGSVLHIGGADDPDRWRGLGCFGWVFDEFSVMKNGDNLYYEAVLPIVKENGGWVDFIYTPKGKNHGYDFYKKAIKNPKWSASFLPADTSGLISQEDWDEICSDTPQRIIDQEFLCKFLDAGGGIFTGIHEAIAGELRPPIVGRRYVLGADLAKRHDWTVLTVIDRDTRQVVAWRRFQQIDWGTQKELIVRLARYYNNALVVPDSTGLGDVICDDLKRLGCSVYKKDGKSGYYFTNKSKKNLINKLSIAIQERRITYPGIEELIDELENFEIDERGRYSAPQGQFDDCVISLALAVEGLGAEAFRPPADEKTKKRRKLRRLQRQKSMSNHGLQYA